MVFEELDRIEALLKRIAGARGSPSGTDSG
jgi:hypothetical protein